MTFRLFKRGSARSKWYYRKSKCDIWKWNKYVFE